MYLLYYLFIILLFIIRFGKVSHKLPEWRIYIAGISEAEVPLSKYSCLSPLAFPKVIIYSIGCLSHCCHHKHISHDRHMIFHTEHVPKLSSVIFNAKISSYHPMSPWFLFLSLFLSRVFQRFRSSWDAAEPQTDSVAERVAGSAEPSQRSGFPGPHSPCCAPWEWWRENGRSKLFGG